MPTNKLTKLIREDAVLENPTTDGNEKWREEVEEELKDQDFEHGEMGLITSIRHVKCKGSTFRLERKDPHGFWYVKPNRGQLPKELSGAFTSVDQATRVVEHYANSK